MACFVLSLYPRAYAVLIAAFAGLAKVLFLYSASSLLESSSNLIIPVFRLGICRPENAPSFLLLSLSSPMTGYDSHLFNGVPVHLETHSSAHLKAAPGQEPSSFHVPGVFCKGYLELRLSGDRYESTSSSWHKLSEACTHLLAFSASGFLRVR